MTGGWLETLRQRLFATWLDTAITLVCLYIVWRISVPLVQSSREVPRQLASTNSQSTSGSEMRHTT